MVRPGPAEQGEVPEWLKGADCKSAASWLRRFESSPLHHSFLAVWWSDEKGGNSSIGRASAFQAEGRGFESRFPLHLARCRRVGPRGSVVEHFLGKEGVTGSIPVVGSSRCGVPSVLSPRVGVKAGVDTSSRARA